MLYSYGTIIVDKSNKSILCLRAYANWDFPKGQQDEGEEGISTAVRETKEETGLIRDVDYEINETLLIYQSLMALESHYRLAIYK